MRMRDSRRKKWERQNERNIHRPSIETHLYTGRIHKKWEISKKERRGEGKLRVTHSKDSECDCGPHLVPVDHLIACQIRIEGRPWRVFASLSIDQLTTHTHTHTHTHTLVSGLSLPFISFRTWAHERQSPAQTSRQWLCQRCVRPVGSCCAPSRVFPACPETPLESVQKHQKKKKKKTHKIIWETDWSKDKKPCCVLTWM